MIDIRALRDDPDAVKAELARRGVEPADVDAVIEADGQWRADRQRFESLRARVKDLSRQVGQAKKDGDDARAEALRAESLQVGEEERLAEADADAAEERRDTGLLYLP